MLCTAPWGRACPERAAAPAFMNSPGRRLTPCGSRTVETHTWLYRLTAVGGFEPDRYRSPDAACSMQRARFVRFGDTSDPRGVSSAANIWKSISGETHLYPELEAEVVMAETASSSRSGSYTEAHKCSGCSRTFWGKSSWNRVAVKCPHCGKEN